MPILTKEVEVKVNGKTIKYYENLGYEIPTKPASHNGRSVKKEFVYDFSKTFKVKVDDLQPNSDIKIDVLCDYCHKEVLTMKRDQYTRSTKEINKIACKRCSPLKVKEVSMLRYGVDNYAKTQECKEKMKFYLEGNFGGTLGVFECSCGYKSKSVENASYYATIEDWNGFYEETKDIMW